MHCFLYHSNRTKIGAKSIIKKKKKVNSSSLIGAEISVLTYGRTDNKKRLEMESGEKKEKRKRERD